MLQVTYNPTKLFKMRGTNWIRPCEQCVLHTHICYLDDVALPSQNLSSTNLLAYRGTILPLAISHGIFVDLVGWI